jgi:hypothetical protein
MFKGLNAAELVKKVSGAKGAELAKSGAKKAAKHGAVDKAIQKGVDSTAEKAIAAAFTLAGGGATTAIKRKRDRRKERRDAVDLARQVGGTYSLNVLIGSDRHHVVWLEDETPYRVFPELNNGEALNELPDLKLFRGVRHRPKPPK